MNDNIENSKWFAIDENGCFCEMKQDPDEALTRMRKTLESIKNANLGTNNQTEWILTLTEKEAKKPKIIRKAIVCRKLFGHGFEAEMRSSSLWEISALVGLGQGLKYAGSLKRGLTGALATAIGIGTINGIRTVIANRHKVTELVTKSDKAGK